MEKIFCTYSKQTDCTYRWDTKIENATLEVTIFKWRVPNPRPSQISVEIFEWDKYTQSIDYLNQEECRANPKLRSNFIVERVSFNEDCHRLTTKYKTDLNNDIREIGDLFIPKTLLGTLPPKRLVIVINWKM